MASVRNTEKVAKFIKELRNLTNTKSAELARAIEKSSGYISNVENQKTPRIDMDVFMDILYFFSERNNNSNVKELINDFIDNQLSSVVEMSSKDIENEILADKQFRMLNIEPEYVDCVLKHITESNLTVEEIMKRLNSNEDLTAEDNRKIKKDNVLTFVKKGNKLDYVAIRFNVKEDVLQRIINKEITSCNYVLLHGILYNIFLCEGHSAEEAYNLAEKELYKCKIYTLDERKKIIRENSLESIVSKIDENKREIPSDIKTFTQTMGGIASLLSKINEVDPVYLNSQLSKFLDNLKNPTLISFVLALIGIDLSSIAILPPQVQKNLFLDTKKYLLDKATELGENTVSLKISQFDSDE